MAGFLCQGLESKCSFKCCSPTNLEVSLHDIANLYPEKIRWGDFDYSLDSRYLDQGYFRMFFVIPMGGEPCKFLEESGEGGYKCVLENEGFGLDMCKMWPVTCALSEEGFRPAILKDFYCPSLKNPLQEEIVRSLFEKTAGLRKAREFYNQDFSRFLSGKILDWKDFSHYLLEWTRGLDRLNPSEGDGFFSLMLDGTCFPKVSFRSVPEEVKTLK